MAFSGPGHQEIQLDLWWCYHFQEPGTVLCQHHQLHLKLNVDISKCYIFTVQHRPDNCIIRLQTSDVILWLVTAFQNNIKVVWVFLAAAALFTVEMDRKQGKDMWKTSKLATGRILNLRCTSAYVCGHLFHHWATQVFQCKDIEGHLIKHRPVINFFYESKIVMVL